MNRLNQFWSEIKRRKVFRVLTMYAATGFIVMEASDIMLPRLGLPDWTVTLIIVLLIIGFPITAIFSWIFDITPEGLIKT
jgi:adenylate cyclase